MTDKLKSIADGADIIVNGYSFTKQDDLIRVLNLNNPEKASVMRMDGEPLETSMDDIEIRIVQEYLARNRRFLED
jgi:hypothetical protein